MNDRKVLFSLILLLFALLIVALFVTDAVMNARRRAREQTVLALVSDAATEFSLSPSLLLAVIYVESDFKADARSAAGARGLMQLMPDTFDYLAREVFHENLSPEKIEDPAVNIRCGAYYLSYLLSRFQVLETALAAYNAGEGRVCEWLEDPSLSDGKRLLSIPFSETEQYVKKVLRAYERYAAEYENEVQK